MISRKARLYLSATLLISPMPVLAHGAVAHASVTPPVSVAAIQAVGTTPGSPANTPSTTSPQGPNEVGQSTASQTSPAQQGLGEIIVTAQQRGENLQKAAVPVAVVSGADLLNSGVRGLDTLGKLVPALVVEPSSQGNLIFIRGVGNFSFVASSDPAAAFNLDGVYVGRSNATFGTFYDLERVEVLKGPQGTLYGRNATAGAINVIPVQPHLGQNSGYGSLSYGSYREVQAEGAGNLGLGPNAALRISGTLTSHRGYNRDGTEDEKTAGARAQFKAKLGSKLTVRIVGDYAQQRGAGAGTSYVGTYAFNSTTGKFDVTPSGLPVNEGLFTTAAQAYRTANGTAGAVRGRKLNALTNRPFQHNEVYGVAAHIDYQTPIGTLSLIPAWRRADKDNLSTESAQQVGDTQRASQYSVEARLVSNPGHVIDYILGTYYFSEKIHDDVHNSTGSLANFNVGDFTTHSPSVYGRLTYHATDWLRFTGGARYTEDHKRYFNGLNQTLVTVCVLPTGCPTAPLLPYTQTLSQQPNVPSASGGRIVIAPGVLVARADTPASGRLNTHKMTFRGAVEIDVGPRSLLYASVETGYRAGGFNTATTYNPENITAYTLGSKNRFFDNRLQLNAELFSWKYRDQQLTYLGISAGRLGVITQNVGRSTVKGAEIEARALVTRTTTLSANIQYLDAQYDSFSYLSPARPYSGCGVTPVGPQFNIDCSGKRAINSPKWTMNLGTQQVIALDDYQVVLSADTQYRSGRSVGFDYIPEEYVNHSWTSNASVSFGAKDGRYVIGAFVRNIENNRVQVYATPVPASNLVVTLNAAPRTYGVRLSTKF